MKRLLILSIYFIFVFQTTAFANSLKEANATFTYNGKPIHPFIVGEFSDYLINDGLPTITSVDIAAATDDYKYHDSEVEESRGWWFASKTEYDGDIPLYESFGYRWIGRLQNGTHVLETGSSGGGSGFFMDLIFVRFSENEIMWEGETKEQLLMSIVGVYSLGDRYNGDIHVYEDKVLIPASQFQHGGGSIEHDIELPAP